MIHVHAAFNLFYPELPGGSNQYFRYGPYLKKQGVQLHVHTLMKPEYGERELEVEGIKITRYDRPEGSSFLEDLDYFTEKAIAAIRASGESGIVQPMGTATASVASVARLWRARLRGVPTCFHYTMMPTSHRASLLRRLGRRTVWKLATSPHRKLLMCSRVMGRAFHSAYGVPIKKIEPVPNGIDLSVFSPVEEARKSELRRELDLPKLAKIVLFVGSVVPRKGVDILVQAWDQVSRAHPDAVLVVVGSTGQRKTVRDAQARTENQQFFEDLLAQVEGLPDPDSVRFVGETGRVQDYYRSADAFAFASHLEGLPSVVLEAMACRVPCVVAPFVGLPDEGEEYGTPGEHYVRSSHEPEVLAKDLAALLSDRNRREAMGKAAAEWMRDHQEMGLAATRLASVYREMLHG